MRACNPDFEIKLSDFLKCIHSWTEIVKIKVVGGWDEESKKMVKGFYLSENVYYYDKHIGESNEAYKRLINYYGDAPIWNVHTELVNTRSSDGYECIGSAIVGNVAWRDVKEAYLQEKKDIKSAKMREKRR